MPTRATCDGRHPKTFTIPVGPTSGSGARHVEQPRVDEQIYWSTFDGANWSAQTAIPGRSTSHAPVVVAFANLLFMFWKGSGSDTRIFHATLAAGPNAIWSAGEEVFWLKPTADGMIRDVPHTDSHPAAVQRGNSLILAYKGQPGDSAVWFMSLSDDEWSGPFTVPGAGSWTGPGVAVLNGTLFMAWKALDPDPELHFSTLQ